MRPNKLPIDVVRREADTWMRDAHAEYVSRVSTPEMAISLELATVLQSLCELLQPRRILDLGSGFSSFVLRHSEATVVSVDDDPDWLARTADFLSAHGLEANRLITWDQFHTSTSERFDLVSHDLGRMRTREQTLPVALGHTEVGGVAVLDDLHKKHYRRVAKRVTRQLTHDLFLLKRETLDTFGRYAGLAIASESNFR